ncbi:MAG: carboxylating nicotinate-nucleotide diphosphorylase [Candidatus Omnitrophica bacterium]|nr:carboxylating nicotinate-nucleotide diphosphorylase [Candidatus Omnitrophota bacterium]
MSLNKHIQSIVKSSLKEDSCQSDITTICAISSKLKGKGIIVAQEKGTLAGIEVAKTVFKLINKNIVFKALKKDGNSFKKGDDIASISGSLQTILTGERVALNFLSLLSGVSTLTKKFVEKTKGIKIEIKDTRKTIPNLRILEKHAVCAGGGYNHRDSLSSGIIIKDNHLKAAGYITGGQLNKKRFGNLMNILRKKSSLKIEVEVESLGEFKEVLKYSPDIIMLDNFSVSNLKKAVCFRNKYYPKIKLEASGGINLKNIKAVANSGVDHVSIGMITDSPEVIDFSLYIK